MRGLRARGDRTPVLMLTALFSVDDRVGALDLGADDYLVNAMRHGTTPIRIGVSQDGALATLWVEDTGPGPAPEILSRLGGRFERSAMPGGTGTGLGLSIVRAVAEAFGGQLRFGRTQGGFRAALELPASGGQGR